MGVPGLFQYRYFARGVNQRELIRESFLFSDCNHAILFFLCFVQNLNSLPEGDMPLISGSKDTIQEA